MLRGMLACALVAAASITATPATAAASPYVVYEAYAVKKNGPKQVPIRVYGMGSGPTVTMQAELKPADDGGYEHDSIGWYWSSGGIGSGGLWSFQDQPGYRHLFVAPRGRVRFLSLSGYWRVRATTIGFRVYDANHGDVDRDVAGTAFDHFHSASAPSGRYGSTLYYDVPCATGVGTWTLTSGTDQAGSGTCVLGDDWDFVDTHGSKPWTLTGPVIGASTARYRFIVLDHPKR